MTNDELQAMLAAAYGGQMRPTDMGLNAEPRSEWESYKYNMANPGRTAGEVQPKSMGWGEYAQEWYDRLIGTPLKGMKGAGDALLGRSNPDLESFEKNVLDALSLYAGPTIAKGMLGGVPRATEVSALGAKGGATIADTSFSTLAKMTPDQEAHLILSTFPEEGIRNSYLNADASIQAALRERVIQGRKSSVQNAPPKDPIE